MNDKVNQLEKKLKKMTAKMEDKCSEVEYLKSINWALSTKERENNNELQDARKELITVLRDLNLSCDGSTIGVKRMGAIDEKPFLKACKKRFTEEEAEMKHAMLCSEWEEKVKDPAWHPFKIVEDGEELKEVVDEEDEKLKNLRGEWGEEVMNAVTTALEEVNEFNPSGRYIVPALWNFEEGREATVEEVVTYMAEKIKTLQGSEA